MANTTADLVTQVLCSRDVDDSLFIIIAAFEEWVAHVAGDRYTSTLGYRDLCSASRQMGSGSPSLVDLESISAENLPHALATEFCFRMFGYYNEVETEFVERCPPPSQGSTPATPSRAPTDLARIGAARVSGATHALSGTAKALPPEEALDFFAHLVVQWARRCNLVGYDPFDPDPAGSGYHLPPGTSREVWITQYLLWSVSEWFKVEL